MEIRPACFSNSFWGPNDLGVSVLLDRMSEAKSTNEEIRQFYKERAIIEDDYARKLGKLAKMPLGTSELGKLKTAIDVLRLESNNIASAHATIASQLKADLEDPHTAFSEAMREKRKVIQNVIEKLFRTKIQQQVELKRAKERRDTDYLKANGFLAQQNLLLGRELERNNMKLEKVQASMHESRNDYEAAVKQLGDTYERWNREWKKACDQFQDLEEERIEALKTSLWAYANIFSQVCVTDDESCERLRLSLEKCEVVNDIQTFIELKGTGNEIPVAPRLLSVQQSSEYAQTPVHDLANFTRDRTDLHGRPSRDRATQKRTNSEQERDNSPENSRTINQFPLDGITQLCRSDSSNTYASISNSVTNSNVATSSVYSSLPASRRNTPNLGHTSQTFPTQQLSRKKSLIERVDLWPRRSPSPVKGLDNVKPLKAQKTGSSIFDALRPARSRSRASIRAETPVAANHLSTSPDRKSDSLLNIGQNLLPVDLSSDRGPPMSSSAHTDPIALALEKLRLESSDSQSQEARRLSSKNLYGDLYQDDRHPAQSRRPHRRVPSRSEPGSPAPEMGYQAVEKQQQHPNLYSSQHPTSSNLGPPPAAHSAEEMRNTTNQYTTKNAAVFYDTNQSPSRPYSDIRAAAPSNARSRASSFHSSQSRSAPGDLRRSPSPKPSAHPVSSDSIYNTDRAHARRSMPAQMEQASRRGSSPRASVRADDGAYLRGQDQSGSPTKYEASDHERQNDRTSKTSQRYSTERLERQHFNSRQSMDNSRVSYEQATNVPQQRASRPRSKSFVETSRPRSQTTRDGKEILAFVMALYDYEATISEEIGFRQGDTLAIVEMREDGWWIGEVIDHVQTRRGLVPSNFFRRVDDPRKITVSTMVHS